jgi:hypothetical protein
LLVVFVVGEAVLVRVKLLRAFLLVVFSRVLGLHVLALVVAVVTLRTCVIANALSTVQVEDVGVLAPRLILVVVYPRADDNRIGTGGDYEREKDEERTHRDTKRSRIEPPGYIVTAVVTFPDLVSCLENFTL